MEDIEEADIVLQYRDPMVVNYDPSVKVPLDSRMFTRRDLKVNFDTDLQELRDFYSGEKTQELPSLLQESIKRRSRHERKTGKRGLVPYDMETEAEYLERRTHERNIQRLKKKLLQQRKQDFIKSTRNVCDKYLWPIMMILIFAKQFHVCNEAYTQYASFSQLDTTHHRYVESPSFSLCLHKSRLRRPERFPSESPCFGNFTSESNPERFKACWYYIMYEAPYSEVYRRQTQSLSSMLKGVSLYNPESQTLVDSTDIRGKLRDEVRPFEKEGYKCIMIQQNATIDLNQVAEGKKEKYLIHVDMDLSSLVDGKFSILAYVHPYGTFPFLGSAQPVTLQLSGPVGEHRITYRETVHVRLPPPYSKCDPEAEPRQSEKCMNECIDRKNRETFPDTTPDNLVYQSWPRNDTRRFDPKYQGAIMTKWGLECRKECPKLDCTQIKISAGKFSFIIFVSLIQLSFTLNCSQTLLLGHQPDGPEAASLLSRNFLPAEEIHL